MVVAKYDAEYQVFYIGVADELPASYSQEWLVTGDVSALINGDSAVYMEFTLDKMFAESPSLTHVTLDVSYNTGGNVGALYRIVGFVTSEPFRATLLPQILVLNQVHIFKLKMFQIMAQLNGHY